MRELALTENLIRADLTPLEEAKAFQLALDAGYTVRSLAERIGKDKGYIENRLAVLKAPADVQDLVRQREDTLRAAREIAKLPDAEERRPLVEGLLDGSLRKADVTDIVRERLSPAPTRSSAAAHENAAAENAGSAASVAQASASSAVTAARAEASDLADRRIDRDIAQVRAIFERWRRELPANQQERAKLIACLDALIPEFEELLEALRASQ
jgi:ParB family chromosome partitioning protein